METVVETVAMQFFWSVILTVISIIGGVCVILWVGAIMGKPKKKAVYWDEKEQQIKTKDGKCLYDKSRFDKMKDLERVIRSANRTISTSNEAVKDIRGQLDTNDNLSPQLQCAAKGHGKWQFSDVWTHNKTLENKYGFRCSDCGLEITKTIKECTAKEREALKGLGL